MPSNLEIKVQLQGFSEIKSKLGAIDSTYWGKIPQKDIYYTYPSGLLKLRMMQKGNELIHYLRNETGLERRSDYNILNVPDEAEEFFGKLFTTDITVEKERDLYFYGNTRIHLDTVKHLGYFLELESVITGSKEDAQREYDYLFENLGLAKYPSIRKSYSDLLKESQK